MRIIEMYKPKGKLLLPHKAASKRFVTRELAKKLRKAERQNRRVGRLANA